MAIGVDWVLVAVIFVWTGFVRTGLGFGGAVLGLPFLLMIEPSPVYWLPIIGIHLLLLASLTLRGAIKQVDWRYLGQSLVWILPPALVGIFGLISLPEDLLSIAVSGIAIAYGLMWLMGERLHSDNAWVDKFLLALGGYVAGLSLTGAPMMVAVYLRHVAKEYLRNTLFVLWFILVSIKMTTFVAFSVTIHWQIALALLPSAYIGHYLGLRAHDRILQNQVVFKRWIGAGLVLVSSLGLIDRLLW